MRTSFSELEKKCIKVHVNSLLKFELDESNLYFDGCNFVVVLLDWQFGYDHERMIVNKDFVVTDTNSKKLSNKVMQYIPCFKEMKYCVLMERGL